MDPELKRRLDEIHALARDNNRVLHSIRRDQWIGFIGKVVFWAVILGLPVYLYLSYIQPLISKYSVPGSNVSTPLLDFLGLPSSAELQKLINSYRAGQ